jgi:L-fuconate dehydratase
MSMQIRDLETIDLRFPTSRSLAGSDSMHRDPDYSAAYVVLKTDRGLEGHGLTFTIGRGNEICVAAVEAMRHLVVGRRLEDITADFAGFWRSLAAESQLRWLGPEKGVIHLALAAIVNAVWDLYARGRGQAALEAARRHDAAADRVGDRLPLHHRRAHAGRGDRHSRTPDRRARRA